MTEHRYPPRTLNAAYLRTAAGMLLTLGPLALVETSLAATLVLLTLAGLFAIYGARTGLRQLTRIRVDADRIAAAGPRPLSIEWRHLASVKLNYYTTRKDGRGGWLQLDIRGSGKTMRIESTLDGFPDVVDRAIREARRRGIELSPSTRDNLRPLGLSPDTEKLAGEGSWPTC